MQNCVVVQGRIVFSGRLRTPFGFDGAYSVQWDRIVVAPVGLCLLCSPIGACSDGVACDRRVGGRKPSLQRVGIGTPSFAEERNALGRG